jgi:hypothetical protein
LVWILKYCVKSRRVKAIIQIINRLDDNLPVFLHERKERG